MGIERKGRVKTVLKVIMPKTVLILGSDGYIGTVLAKHLKNKGHKVTGLDDFSRRDLSKSLIPVHKRKVDIECEVQFLNKIDKFDTIIHLAEQPSAPWSMLNRLQSIDTQEKNVLGTLNLLWLMKSCCPDAHLIKLGSMGEYGTPDCVIPEGFIEDGPMRGLMFPRSPNSFYHLSKVFDSMNIDFACRTWGLRSTDIMQGVVFGIGGRFDYDEYFGTVINRFCTQAVAGIPLTVYGKGGQTRGYLPIQDSIECITRILENPPEKGEYRVVNQFAETYSINELAETVQGAAKDCGLRVGIQHIENPRSESESHFFQPDHNKLKEMGYNPEWDLQEELIKIIQAIIPYKDRIDRNKIYPTTKWTA